MNKTRSTLFLCLAAVTMIACKKNGATDNFDYEAQFRADTTQIRKFITEKNIPVIKLESGVFCQIIEKGEGVVKYTGSTTIHAEYEGRLLNGFVFDQTRGTPVSFALGRVIDGWQIGIPQIQKGGKVRLIIPSQYGYGNAVLSSIPANSILDFTVSLIDVKP